MRKLAFMSLLALPLAVGCNGGGDDTGATDTDTDTDTEGPSYSLASASSTYQRDHGGTEVCNLGFDLSGTEYSSADCPDCEFAFLIDATQTAGADTTPPCPSQDPYPYGWPSIAAGGGAYLNTGMGYVESGDLYYSGLLLDATSVFFTFLDYNGLMYYTRLHGGSVYYGGNQYDFSNYGTFEMTGLDFSWTYGFDFESGVGASQAFCDDPEIVDREEEVWGTQEYGVDDGPALADLPNEPDTPDDTADGTLTDCNSSMVDSYTVEVADGDTLTAAIDVPSGSSLWDPRVYVNNADGCTVVQADDQFECAAGNCPSGAEDDADTTTDDSVFECCSAAETTNDSGSAQTYEIFVMATQFICGDRTEDENDDTWDDADYTLSISTDSGDAQLSSDKDDYFPTIDITFDGSGTLAEN